MNSVVSDAKQREAERSTAHTRATCTTQYRGHTTVHAPHTVPAAFTALCCVHSRAVSVSSYPPTHVLLCVPHGGSSCVPRAVLVLPRLPCDVLSLQRYAAFLWGCLAGKHDGRRGLFLDGCRLRDTEA